MISMFLAHTKELDDPEYAVLEILKGLNLDDNLLKNSVGIIHCSDAFISAGVVKEIAKSLPFPLIGMNALLNSSNLGIIDNLILTVSVLTSQTVKFSVALSPPIENDIDTAIREAYKNAQKDLAGHPAMAITFTPTRPTYPNGEDIVETFNEISEGTPLFGAFASDYSTTIRTPKVIFGGEDYKDSMAILLIKGEVTPRFFCYPVSNKDTIRHKAIVTESEGTIIKKVNGLPVIEYFESLGLYKDGHLLVTYTIPIFVDLHNGYPPLVRTISTQTPEGHIILSGKAPVDTTLGIGGLNIAQIQEGAERMSKLIKLSNPNFFFAYSCISRNFSLGFNYTTEMEVMQNNIQGSIPYLFAYTCGELCPIIRKDGRWHNEYHNMSLISFAL